MLVSVVIFGLILLTFIWIASRVLNRNKLLNAYYQPNAEENIFLPAARITGIAYLLLIIGFGFAAAAIWQFNWPFNFNEDATYITLIAFVFSLMVITVALRLYMIRNGVIQMQFIATGIWVPNLQPPVRRHLFLDLLANKKFKIIEYKTICRAEHRETLSGSQIVLIETTGSTTLAVYIDDQYDADKLIKKINNKATGIDVLNVD
jgi:hypothetical protein